MAFINDQSSHFSEYLTLMHYMMPSALSFCCHFHAEASTSSRLASAFHPNTLLALVQSPHIFSISPSRRGPYFQLSFTPVARSKVSTISSVELPLPVPMLKYDAKSFEDGSYVDAYNSFYDCL